MAGARWRHRYRLVGRADHPGARPRSGKLVVFQRTANHVVPAHNRPMDDAWRTELRATATERRAVARQSPIGLSLEAPSRAPAPRRRGRRAEYERRWSLGGFNMLVAFNDIDTDERAAATADAFVRDKIRRDRRRPSRRRAVHARRPSVRDQAGRRRRGLLRDVQPRQRPPGRRADRGDRAGVAGRGQAFDRRGDRARRDRVRDRFRLLHRRDDPRRRPRHRRRAARGSAGPTVRTPTSGSQSPGSRTSS